MASVENQDILNALEGRTGRQLLDARTIVLSEGINSRVAKRVIEQLLSFDLSDPNREILMFLNSPGGEVNSGFAIYDTMRFIRPKTKIVVSGLAASIATIILLGADKANRLSLPNSQLLIHQPLIGGSMQGQASDIEITAKEILKTREKIAELYVKETGQPLERVNRDIERDYWMSAREALDYGLISRIVNSRNEIS